MKTKSKRAASSDQRSARARGGVTVVKTLRRCSNWPAMLDLFIEEKRHQPFDWRHNNCAFFASDWIVILTGGEDPARAFRRGVTSPLTAARRLRAAGGLEQLAADYCAAHGWPECPVGQAQRGDWAMVMVDAAGIVGGQGACAAYALGVVLGRVVAHAGPQGVVFVPKALARRAWRIG